MQIPYVFPPPPSVMPPARLGRESPALTVRLAEIEEELLRLQIMRIAGAFSSDGWSTSVEDLLPARDLPQPLVLGRYPGGLPTVTAPNHWHVLMWLEHWAKSGLIPVAKWRSLATYTVRHSGQEGQALDACALSAEALTSPSSHTPLPGWECAVAAQSGPVTPVYDSDATQVDSEPEVFAAPEVAPGQEACALTDEEARVKRVKRN